MKKAKSRKIKLDQIQLSTKKIYEMSSEISLLQEQLDDMLSVINQNFMDYKKGRISEVFFRSNERKLKTRSLKLMKTINRLIVSSVGHTDKIGKEVKNQKVKVK